MDIRAKQEEEDEKEWVKRESRRKMFVWEAVRLTMQVDKSWEITHTHTLSPSIYLLMSDISRHISLHTSHLHVCYLWTAGLLGKVMTENLLLNQKWSSFLQSKWMDEGALQRLAA